MGRNGQGGDEVQPVRHAGGLAARYARRDGASIIEASGEIDLATIHLLEEMLGGVMDDGKALVVDLHDVSYIDTTGLNMLMRLHEQCARRKTNMAVVFTSRNLWRIFSALSLQDVFRIFPSVDEALRALSHPDGAGRPSARGEEADISTDRLD